MLKEFVYRRMMMEALIGIIFWIVAFIATISVENRYVLKVNFTIAWFILLVYIVGSRLMP
jgi:hypothetical protein